MERLDRTAVRAVRTLLENQPTTIAKVTFAWTLAAGPALANAVTLRWSEDGTLRIRPKSEMWRREVIRARPLVGHRLAELLGEGAVKRIVIE
jgi:hypothetical protein